MLFHWDYSDVCLVMAVGSWVLERMPRDKCHLTTSHQRITPSTRPHAAEADWGSGWQMLVRSPCCQFFFFFLSQCTYLWIHLIITMYILSILYFYLLTVPQESQKKINVTDLSFFILCSTLHSGAQSLSTAQAILRAENPHESLGIALHSECIYSPHLFIYHLLRPSQLTEQGTHVHTITQVSRQVFIKVSMGNHLYLC